MPILASVAVLPLVDDHMSVPEYEMIRTLLCFAAMLGAILAIGCVFSHSRVAFGIAFVLIAVGIYKLQSVSAARRKKEN